METTSFLLECTQCLPDAEAISAKIMGGGGAAGDDSDDDVVEVEAVVAVSRDDQEDDEKEDATDKSNDSANAVSSGTVMELPDSIAEDKKKKGDSPTATPPTDTTTTKRTSVEVSATTPRGKFELTLYEKTGLILRNQKDEVVTAPSTSVSTVIIFPKAEDCRKSGSRSKKKGPAKRPGSLVLVVLDGEEEEVIFRGKALKQICFQLPLSIVPSANDDDESNGGSSDGGGGGVMELVEPPKKDIELEWVELLAKTFDVATDKIALVSNPAYLTDDGKEERTYCGRYEFKSDQTEGTSTTTAGMPFVKCYESVNDGVLYPLEEGLLFFKPPKFVPRSTLHSIQCGRGGGDSRYVDLVATLEGEEGASVEFSNIAREEVRVLNDYIHKVLIKAMAKDAAEGEEDGETDGSSSENAKDANIAEIGTGTSSDKEDDDEVEAIDESSDGRKRSRRAASREAREATKAQLQAKAAGDGNGDVSDDDEEEDFKVESDVESETGEEEEEGADDATESEADEDEEDEESDGDEDGSPKKKARKEWVNQDS